MRTVQVYDRPIPTSAGSTPAAGAPDKVSFGALLDQFRRKNVMVERYDMGEQNMACVQNPAVTALLKKEGAALLPLILVDGEIRLKGHYPTRDELVALSRSILGEGSDPPA